MMKSAAFGGLNENIKAIKCIDKVLQSDPRYNTALSEKARNLFFLENY